MRRCFWSILAAVSVCCSAQCSFCAEPADRVSTRVAEAYGRIAAKYGIEIVFADPKFPEKEQIAGRVAAAKDVEDYLSLFASEWAFYPPELVKKSKLRRIVLCDDLTLKGQRAGGCSDYKHNVLFIDMVGHFGQMHARKTLHHEFFHLLDRADNGLADKPWVALNAEGFTYGSGGAAALADPSSTSRPTDRVPGFINTYSQSSVREDKAEVYAHMITMWPMVVERTKADPVLKAKVDRMKELVKDFCPQADEEFWRAARKVRR